ncbi:hypothetical protein U8P80_02990 [Rhizobium beringeri]|uniref:hypothetical protein n=1 Tax=Rhizobium TaxID=379 RepID=UPI001FDF25D0|nr:MULTISPECIES: hypothetical protein [Rhizobium]WSG74799.1 hypothetical protein U8P80_02990 [Rhizobium beringeri]WSH14994.1 hypothetical protein U8P74_02990 [Rhizobium beringeri]
MPALLARFSPTEDDPGLEAEPTAVLRIRVDRYHGDRRKLALGPTAGQAVKLCRDISLGGVGIAEGVEKGLALIAAGWRPVWATCGTATRGRVGEQWVPQNVSAAIGTGEKPAAACSKLRSTRSNSPPRWRGCIF